MDNVAAETSHKLASQSNLLDRTMPRSGQKLRHKKKQSDNALCWNATESVQSGYEQVFVSGRCRLPADRHEVMVPEND